MQERTIQTVLGSEASAAQKTDKTQKKKMQRICLGRSCGDPIGCLPSGQSDPGLVLAQSDGIGSAGEAFIALAKLDMSIATKIHLSCRPRVVRAGFHRL